MPAMCIPSLAPLSHGILFSMGLTSVVLSMRISSRSEMNFFVYQRSEQAHFLRPCESQAP